MLKFFIVTCSVAWIIVFIVVIKRPPLVPPHSNRLQCICRVSQASGSGRRLLSECVQYYLALRYSRGLSIIPCKECCAISMLCLEWMLFPMISMHTGLKKTVFVSATCSLQTWSTSYTTSTRLMTKSGYQLVSSIKVFKRETICSIMLFLRAEGGDWRWSQSMRRTR